VWRHGSDSYKNYGKTLEKRFMSIIDEIKEIINLADVVGKTASVKLRKSGANQVGYCPFHNDKHKPNLVVYQNGSWNCFSCGEHGDVIDWVEKINHWDTTEAIKYLAKMAGIELRGNDTSMPERVEARKKESVKRVAMGVFKKWLLGENDKDGKQIRAGDAAALAYALDRGWALGTIQNGGLIGFSGRATAAEYNEMRGEFSLNGIDPLSPEAVMVLGFKGDVGKWASAHGIDPKELSDNYIQGYMERPGLIYAHKFNGRIEYLSERFLPGFDTDRKSHNPSNALAGKRRAFRNAHYHHLQDGQDKGALLYIVEGQGCAKTFDGVEMPSVALCGSSWENLREDGEIEDWLSDYEEHIYVTDADTAGERVVTGKNNKYEMANALGAMLWVGRTANKTWKRPDGSEKTIKDVNDIAQYLKDTQADEKTGNGLYNEIAMKAERIMVLAARYAGTLAGHAREQMVEKIVRPMILSVPEEKRVNYTIALADALYSNIGSATGRKSEFNKWLNTQKKAAAAAAKSEEDEDHIREVETVGGYFKNPKDPSEGWVVDMTYDLATQKAMLAYRDDKGEIGTAKQLDIYGVRYYPKVDDFVRKGVVVFPSDLGPLVSTSELLKIHEAHNRKSILLDKPTDYSMASFYSVFSWVFDCFNELPFLRARGGKDTGKSAIMLRIGYLCYRLAKSTGIGSTASLKHAQELYKCTIFFDEMDIADKFDERIVMLNVRAMKDQANVWSMKAVTDINGDQNYEPQAHNVYGCALITMYGAFSDEATDSRCITFDLFGKDIAELKAKGIPRRLNAAWHAEALRIRNMSLHWRLKNWQPDLDIPDELEDEMVSTRANQVTVPIKYIVKDDPIALAEVTATVREMYADEIVQKAQSYEARFLEAIIALTETNRFSILDFIHETDMKEHGHAKYIRYPDLAKVVNFLLDEMNSGISKEVQTITMKPTQEKEDEEEDKGKGKGKGKKKKGEPAGVSTKTVGDQMRAFQIPVKRLGPGYVVIVWSQSHPEECQNRIDKLKKRFGLEFLNDGQDISEPVKMSATALMVPDDPPIDEQMELYAQMADDDE
jgi:hypothetical protein